jgi:hypothetical protein
VRKTLIISKDRKFLKFPTYSNSLKTDESDRLLTEESSYVEKLPGDISDDYLKKLNKKYKVPVITDKSPQPSSQDVNK